MSVKNNEEKERGVAYRKRSESPGSSSSAVAVLGSLHLDIMVYAPDRPRKARRCPETPGCTGRRQGGNQAVAAAQLEPRLS